jgi:signal transduction histidine kinase
LPTGSVQRLSPWQALKGPFALNWRTHLLFFVPASSSGIFSDYIRLGGSPLSWLVVVVVGYSVTVLAIELLEQLFERVSILVEQVRHLVVLLLAGLIRGTAIYLVGSSLGVIPVSDFSYRVFGAPIFVIATYIIFNTLIASYLQQREVTLRLRRERAGLNESRVLFADEIVRLRQAQKAKIQELIAPSMWEISKHVNDAKLSKNASNLIKALRGLNEEVVRPLSHEMTRAFELPSITTSVAPLARLGRFTIPRVTTLGNSLPVGWLVVFTSLVGYSSQAVRSGLVQALTDTIAGTLWVWIASQLVKRVTANVEHLTWVGFALAFPIGGLVGLSTQALLEIDSLNFAREFPLQAALFLGLSYPSIYMISVANLQNARATQQLKEVIQELKLLNSQLRQQVWLDQKMLATQLHGSIQAALHAAALQLAQLENATVDDLERVRVAVEKAMATLGDTAYLEGHSFRQLLDDIAEVWHDSSAIQYQLDESLVEAMKLDPRAARCTVEVTREAITNAIKHGQAKNILVVMKLEGDLVAVNISNDGLIPGHMDAGMGSEVIAELTHTTKLEINSGTVVFSATIPLSLGDVE